MPRRPDFDETGRHLAAASLTIGLAADRVELRVGQLDLQGGQVFLQVLERQRPRDRQHRRRAPEKPRERDLHWRRAVARGDLFDGATAVAAQREEGDVDDVLPLAVVDDFLVLALREVVVVLDGGDRYNPAGSLDLVDRDLGDADVPDLAAVAVLIDGGETLFERCLRVDPVQVVERDAVGAQPAKALLDLGVEDVRTPATGAAASAALRRYDATLGLSGERRTDRLLALPTGVGVGRVDHPHTGGDRFPHEGNARRRVAEAVRSQADAGDLGVTESQ